MASEAFGDLLRREREGVLDRAFAVTRHVRSRHDNGANSFELRELLEHVYDAVLVAVTCRNLGPAVEYAQQLAGERYDRGYGLAELQALFNALEESLWEQLLTDVPASDVPDALTLVSSIFGVAKDTLACAYVAAATQTRHGPLDLESLAAGAVSS
jgi:hypothetical protein